LEADIHLFALLLRQILISMSRVFIT